MDLVDVFYIRFMQFRVFKSFSVSTLSMAPSAGVEAS